MNASGGAAIPGDYSKLMDQYNKIPQPCPTCHRCPTCGHVSYPFGNPYPQPLIYTNDPNRPTVMN